MAAPDHQRSDATKVLLHFIQAMTWPMLIAHGLIVAFFVYGLSTSLIKLSGREIASIDFPVGPVVGALSGVLFIVIVAILKLRLRDD